MAKKRIAQYKQIEHDLLEKINLGYYKKDDLIPTELELSNTYQVSRVTVRKATDNLVAQGLLSRVAGVGTFVCHPSVTLNPSSIQGFSDAMKDKGLSVHTEVPTFMIQKAPANIASILEIEKDEPMYFIERSGMPMTKSFNLKLPICLHGFILIFPYRYFRNQNTVFLKKPRG